MKIARVLCLLVVSGALQGSAAQSRVEIVVTATTDVHGRIRGWDYYGNAPDTVRGLSRAATVIDSIRAQHRGGVVLVDAGDLLQGNPLAYVAARRDTLGPHPIIAAMNAMGYDAAVVGNHEFNYGLPTLRRALRQAAFPFLAANVTALSPRGQLPIVGSTMVTRRGLKVGIVGATTPGAMVWDRDNLRGALRVGDILPAVRRQVTSLRARGAGAIVVVLHSGLGEVSSYDTIATALPSENVAARVAREVPGIDLIVFGHSHREIADTTINGVLLVQPRNWATSVGVATLGFERSGGAWHATAKKGAVIPVVGRVEHAGVIAAARGTHEQTIAYVNTKLGTTATRWRSDSARVLDTPLIDLVLDVERRVTGADLASTAAFDLNATLEAGDITVAQIARLYPYDNTLRAVRITGKQLRAYLEHSARYFRTLGSAEASVSLVDPNIPGFNFDIIAGAEYVIDVSRPLGQRVTTLRVRGKPVEDSDTFTLALNNYRQTGGGGYAMLSGSPVVYDRGQEIRDLLIDEVRRRAVLRPEDVGDLNWRIEPANAVDALQRAIRNGAFERSTAPVGSATTTNAHLSQGRWLRIIGTNDFHGALEPGDFSASGIVRGGAGPLMTMIERARAECRPPTCTSVWLDGGDQWQGTIGSNRAFGRPVVEIFNRFGLAAAAVGNHEFDWGVDTLRARMREARYPMLAANVTDTLGRDLAWIPNDTLLDLGSVKLGVIGVLTVETPTATRLSNVKGFRFVDPAPIVDRLARALRQRGADVVAVVAHAGAACDANDFAICQGEIIDLASKLTERVDAIVAGHLHRPAATVVRGTAVTQAYSRGSAISITDIALDRGQAPRVSLRNVLPDSAPAHIEAVPFVERAVADLRRAMSRTVAEIGEPIRRGRDSRLGDLVADAHRFAGQGDVAVMNQGGVRADLAPGTLTEGGVFQVSPFDNRIYRVRLVGSELRKYLERIISRQSGFHLSGIRVVFDSTKAPGQRIVSAVLFDGAALQDTKVYTLVYNDFIATGGDGLRVEEKTVGTEETEILDRDALASYLRSLPQPVRAPEGPRVVRKTS